MKYRLKIKLTGGAYFSGEKVERTIEIPGTKTLRDLCLTILDSIDFDFEHMFAFTVKGIEYVGEPYKDRRDPCKVKLEKLGLKVKEKFTLLYDFGDDWLFTVTVAALLSDEDREARVVSSVGEIEQYPVWDDEEDWDDDDGEDRDDDGEDRDDDGEDWEDIGGENGDDDEDRKIVPISRKISSPDTAGEAIPEVEKEQLPAQNTDNLLRPAFGKIPEKDKEDVSSGQDVFSEIEKQINAEWDYRPSEELLEAAFRYKKTKLWKKLGEEEFFAFKRTDGSYSYVSIMGKSGLNCAVRVYPGDEAFQTHLQCYRASGKKEQFYETQENFMGLNCVSLIFEKKLNLRDEEREPVRAYAKAHDIKLTGVNAYPHVIRFLPYKYPWFPESGEIEAILLEAVEAATFAAGKLETGSAEKIGFADLQKGAVSIPLIEKKDGAYRFSGMHSLPERKPSGWYHPETANEIAVQKLKR